MKIRFGFIIIALVVFAVIFAVGKDHRPDKETLDSYKEIIYKDVFHEVGSGASDIYPAVVIDIIDAKRDREFTKVYATVSRTDYSFNGAVFEVDTGYSTPCRYDIDKDGNIIEKWLPKDGSSYAGSIMEMAENDKALASAITNSDDDSERYQDQMDSLKKTVLDSGLKKKEFSFDLKKIPGHDKNMKYIKNNVPEGSVCVIDKNDYDELQKERKEIVPSFQEGSHWIYRNCILWNEKTGICTEYVLDYSR